MAHVNLYPLNLLQNGNEVPVVLEDKMPAHLISQTLKYLWLLFGADDFGSEWVFSAGGHPIRASGETQENATRAFTT